MWRDSLIFLTLFCGSVTLAQFPNDPKPCAYGDTKCIAERIKYYVQEKASGDASINLGTLDPLIFKKIEVKQGGGSGLNVDLILSDNKLYGIKNSKILDVQGFQRDPNGKYMIKIQSDTWSITGPYRINGKVLILPINGQGSSNLTLWKPTLTVNFNGEGYEKNGETYLKIKDVKTDVQFERIRFHFDNLFNGDEALGKAMNDFLNENGAEIFEDIKKIYEENSAKKIYKNVNEVFKTYPYDKFFSQT